tara:strand:- start:1530 stop:1658 length:129 start_codon:yes stop_codon:yes gene_type:complete
MAKNKKLNSKNPKFLPKKKEDKQKKIFLREVKGCKIYINYEN